MPARTGKEAAPYALQRHDSVRDTFESEWFARLLPGLLCVAEGGELLDLGCGDDRRRSWPRPAGGDGPRQPLSPLERLPD